MKRHILLTRPEPQNQPLIQALTEQKLKFSVQPLLTIEKLPSIPFHDLGAIDGIIVTSANALYYHSDLSPFLSIPLLAVGDMTADAAKNAGFQTIYTAAGHVDSVLERLPIFFSEPCTLLYITGQYRTRDLCHPDYQIIHYPTYIAHQIGKFDEDFLNNIAHDPIHDLVFYSKRTFESFLMAVAHHDLLDHFKECHFYGFSPAICRFITQNGYQAVDFTDVVDLLKKLRDHT
jgi:uroporphyrinogen-III synthase